ncbi:MAG TPA: DUF4307 domain-containing protein [Nocardioidaceae bacterium]|nr:DUF4307 domain-containing protein [Nocardioidaceae bacterium]
MTDLAHRYGTPSPARRRVLIAGVALVALAGMAWLTWTVIYQSTPQVRSGVERFAVQDDHTSTIVLRVVREDDDVVATCFVRAVSSESQVIGEATAVVRSGPLEQDVEVTIRTERRPATIEGLGCTAPGQPQRK